MSETISLAVWDVPMPAVAGEMFSIKVGATAAAGGRVEVSDASGNVVASGTLGNTPWPGTEALYWAALDVPAPADLAVAEYSVRCKGPTSKFTVVAAGRPEHTLKVTVAEQNTTAALDGVEIRLGPFHARTGKDGRAELHVCKGDYELQLWRTAHIAPSKSLTIGGDTTVELTMVHVPEDHPDARWVR